MSTVYRTQPGIPWSQFLANLPAFVKPAPNDDETDQQKCFTDGSNYLWAYDGVDGFVDFTRYGRNFVDDLLESVADKFGVAVLSEHHPDFFKIRNEVDEDIDESVVA